MRRSRLHPVKPDGGPGGQSPGGWRGSGGESLPAAWYGQWDEVGFMPHIVGHLLALVLNGNDIAKGRLALAILGRHGSLIPDCDIALPRSDGTRSARVRRRCRE